MISLLGARCTAYVHGVRFAYLLWRRPRPDLEVKLLKALLKDGDVAVDVGANGADWTYFLHRRVGRRGRVFAFEADPYYALATAVAVRIMRLQGVAVFAYGLSDKHERAFLRTMDAGGRRSSGTGFIDKDSSGRSEGCSVELRPLDSLTGSYPALMQTALLKVDVEGFELYVLRGAASILAHARPTIIFEVAHYEKQGYTERDMHAFLANNGYRTYALVQQGGLAPTDARLAHPAAAGVNRVALPEEYDTANLPVGYGSSTGKAFIGNKAAIRRSRHDRKTSKSGEDVGVEVS